MYLGSLNPRCCCPGPRLSACSRTTAGSERVFCRHCRRQSGSWPPTLGLSACRRARGGAERVFCRHCSAVRQLACSAKADSLQHGKSWPEVSALQPSRAAALVSAMVQQAGASCSTHVEPTGPCLLQRCRCSFGADLPALLTCRTGSSCSQSLQVCRELRSRSCGGGEGGRPACANHALVGRLYGVRKVRLPCSCLDVPHHDRPALIPTDCLQRAETLPGQCCPAAATWPGATGNTTGTSL